MLTATRRVLKRHIIAGTELAFLFLNERIIEMHVVFDRGDILMTEQLLQCVNVAAEHEVTHGESMSEDVGADTLALRQIGALADTLKQHVHAATSQRETALTEENVIFVRITQF